MATEAGIPSPPGGWSWPDDLLPELQEEKTVPQQRTERPGSKTDKSWTSTRSQPSATSTSAESTDEPSSTPRQRAGASAAGTRQQQQRSQRHWKPRTCRICLETVLPTFHPPSENLPGFFQGAPSVTYDSEGGRLLRPCKCKGSARYVHESCLQEWRHADPSYGRRNFWNCPTCGFRYRLERLQWGRWVSSRLAQIFLTLLIFMTTVFLLGFIADPIINLYLDPYRTMSSRPSFSRNDSDNIRFDDDYDETWTDHFAKGLASLGLLGFVKVIISLGPWHWWRIGSGGFGSTRPGSTGRDRVASIGWIVVVLGVCTFLYTVWKAVRAWSRRVLEKAGERVQDVQGDEDVDDDEDDETND